MDNIFEAGVETLRQKLLLMASRAGASVSDSVLSLLQRDLDLALKVRQDDKLIDQCEVEIDELAVQLLTQAPLAVHLRSVTVVMKIAQNLERIGDEAAKIAKRARDLAKEPPVSLPADLPRLAAFTLAMLNDALDAFVNRDSAAARTVILRDPEADAIHRQIQAVLMQHMAEHPDTIPRCLHWMTAAKSLERIADHATNIAEEVVYLCEAQDIRHSGFKHSAPANT
jgi:phosphate transport system protein